MLSGSASELERDLPFWVFVDALDEYVEGSNRIAWKRSKRTYGTDWRRCSRRSFAFAAPNASRLPATSATGFTAPCVSCSNG